jgi:transcriptional regulator with XRE-family HTH domain
MKHSSKAKRRVRFTNRLWRERRRTGLSQQRVADLVGYHSPCEISRFERGERLPSLVMAMKLEIVYHTPVAFLFPDLYVRLREAIREKQEQLADRPCRRKRA